MASLCVWTESQVLLQVIWEVYFVGVEWLFPVTNVTVVRRIRSCLFFFFFQVKGCNNINFYISIRTTNYETTYIFLRRIIINTSTLYLYLPEKNSAEFALEGWRQHWCHSRNLFASLIFWRLLRSSQCLKTCLWVILPRRVEWTMQMSKA